MFQFGAVLQHQSQRVFHNAAHCAAPAGVRGADDAVFEVGKQNRRTVGGCYAEQDSGPVRYQTVGLDPVQRRGVCIFGMAGYALTGKSGGRSRHSESAGGNVDILPDVFRGVGTFAVDVQAFVAAV